MLDCGLVAADGKLNASSAVVLTDAGLAFLQQFIPRGAVRPVYDVASRKLSVAGEVMLTLAVQARNLSPFLAAAEKARWPPRIIEPLGARPCRNDAHFLAVAAHSPTSRQALIDFHADDGAATWNWRMNGGRRQVNGMGWSQQGAGAQFDVILNEPWPSKEEEPNGDGIYKDESANVTAASHFYSADVPGTASPNAGAQTEIVFRSNFREFLRVSFDGPRPNGNSVQGSRCSDYQPWYIREDYVPDGNGQWQPNPNNKPDNVISKGGPTDLLPAP
ncbi:MAG TPA: hypothetical protein VFW87_20595 [Pirellulales bacterium]|nr:hypothetical protein [Pirellulales bacterium]